MQTAERDCSKSGIVYGSTIHVVPLILVALQRAHTYTTGIPRRVSRRVSTIDVKYFDCFEFTLTRKCGTRVRARCTMYY